MNQLDFLTSYFTPLKREYCKNSLLASMQTVCEPISCPEVLHLLSRKYPVIGSSLQRPKGSPSTLMDLSICMFVISVTVGHRGEVGWR